MKFNLIAAAALLLSLAASAAQASAISFDTRAYSGGALASANAYKSTIEDLVAAAPTTGYGSTTTISSFDNVSNNRLFGGTQRNIASRSVFNFQIATPGTWSFRAGVDFGLGGALFLDGTALAWRSSDMWWSGSYGATQSFSVSTSLLTGAHTLTLYGLENCCDGGMQAQFRAPGGDWTTFSTADGLAVPSQQVTANQQADVPEPASLAILGGSLATLGLAARRRRRV